MSVVFKRSALAAIGVALSVTTAQAASLGLATTGPVDTGLAEISFFGIGDIAGFANFASGGASNFFVDPLDLSSATFDSGGDVASVIDFAFMSGMAEFELTAFDSYTNGALLTADLSLTSLAASVDPLSDILAFGVLLEFDVPVSLQALASTTTAIPLPAGILLLGTALGGLGFARKRRAA